MDLPPFYRTIFLLRLEPVRTRKSSEFPARNADGLHWSPRTIKTRRFQKGRCGYMPPRPCSSRHGLAQLYSWSPALMILLRVKYGRSCESRRQRLDDHHWPAKALCHRSVRYEPQCQRCGAAWPPQSSPWPLKGHQPSAFRYPAFAPSGSWLATAAFLGKSWSQ